jgi:hypothetical protein
VIPSVRNSPLELLDLTSKDHFQVVDEAGARNTIQNKTPLSTFFHEAFYTVHPKAQKRVPVPTELNLDSSFNSKSFRRLLDYELWSGSGVEFFPTLHLSQSIGVSTGKENPPDPPNVIPLNSMETDVSMVSSDRIFMLNSDKLSRSDPTTSLSQALALSDDVVVKHKRKLARHDKVNRKEFLPAGALIISSDEEQQSSFVESHKRKVVRYIFSFCFRNCYFVEEFFHRKGSTRFGKSIR